MYDETSGRSVINSRGMLTRGCIGGGVQLPAGPGAPPAPWASCTCSAGGAPFCCRNPDRTNARDRKSTRLNSSHLGISYAVFCLKKKKRNNMMKNINSTSQQKQLACIKKQ